MPKRKPNPATKNRWYGWKRDPLDKRDMMFSVPKVAALPKTVDLSGGFPYPPFNQGAIGSCQVNMSASLITFNRKKQGLPVFLPSRLFAYYNVRLLEGTVDQDSGACIRDTVKAANQFGSCYEETWPYVISKFKVKPPQPAYNEGSKYKALQYQQVPMGLNNLRSTLAGGFPFGCGIMVYESFEGPEVSKTGVVNLPDVHKERQMGGHAITICGYDDDAGRFKCLNSWGTDWGMGGYFTIPYQYLTDNQLSADFWVITVVS